MPFDPVLTLETAALLLICFLVGATLGSMLHLAVLRRRKPSAARQAAAVGVAAPTGEALVATPVIAPLAVPPKPTAPDEVPALDFGFDVGADGRVAAAPARKAGTATSGRDVGRPDRLVAATTAEPEAATSMEVVETPPEIVVDQQEVVAEAPEQGTDASTNKIDPPKDDQGMSSGTDVTAELLALLPEEPVAQAVVENGVASADADEFAAMRAIEGNWTPRRKPRKPVVEPVLKVQMEREPALDETGAILAEPEPALEPVPIVVVTDDEEELRPRADETMAEVPSIEPLDEDDRIVPADADVEAAPARVEPQLDLGVQDTLDQPQGIGAPRYGMRDDLTQIVGVLPVVETALNRIGVYHFDQVAEWSDANSAWVEAHLGIGGRVDREHWREQARELATIAAGGRPSRKRRPSS